MSAKIKVGRLYKQTIVVESESVTDGLVPRRYDDLGRVVMVVRTIKRQPALPPGYTERFSSDGVPQLCCAIIQPRDGCGARRCAKPRRGWSGNAATELTCSSHRELEQQAREWMAARPIE